jgi:hypothetical protein
MLWFFSALLTVRPELVITQWEQKKNDETHEKAEQINQVLALEMLTRLERSIAINPLDATSHLLMARYYEALTNNKSNEYSKLAENEYKIAVKHQASWGYAWARLANFYSNQSELNTDAFMHALSKAMFTSPFERKNQEVIIPLIFKHWPLLLNNKEKQVQAIKVIKHTLLFNSYPYELRTIDYAKKHHRLKELAPLLIKQWHKDRLNKYLREAANE